MRNNGFWIFERTILDHKLWHSPNTGRVWLYLMNVATHKPQPAEFEGRSISLKPGQAIVKRAEIGKKLRLSPSSISRSLASLAATGAPMKIDFKSDGAKYLVTMPYWESSQSNGQAQKAPCAPPCASDSEKLRLSCASPLTNNNSNKGERGASDEPESLENPAAESLAATPDPLVARGWEWTSIERLYASMLKVGGETFDFTRDEWRAAWQNLMAARCLVTGYPKLGKNRLATDPRMAMADQIEFLRRFRPASPSGSTGRSGAAATRAREPWQIQKDLAAEWAVLAAHPGNPAAGFASPSDTEKADFLEKRAAVERNTREAK